MKKYILFLIFILFFGIISFVFFTNKQKCFSLTQTLVSWNSMSGILQDGENIQVWEGYYNCHNIHRWDIVIYQTLSRGQLVKEVKVLPWDLLEADFEKWYLVVNTEVLSNYSWEKYIFTRWELEFMQLYFQEGVMKDENYFIFWTTTFWWYDSRKFAWIMKKDLIWKVFLKD